MRLSASTRLTDNLCRPFTDEIKIMKSFGFEGLDFNLNHDLSIMLGDNWRERVEKTAEKSYQYDLPVIQTHLPYKYLRGAGPQAAEIRAVEEAIIATEIMGSPYAVFHAISPYDGALGASETYEFYMPVRDFAQRHNVKLLVEVMPDYCTYPLTAEDLCYISDKMEIGVCWDTGHYNVNKAGRDANQGDQLRTLGSRLKALHVNDNSGGRVDEHLAPYLGSIDWDDLVPVLKEIGYEGDFNFEVLTRRKMPVDFVPELAAYIIKSGKRLINMCE